MIKDSLVWRFWIKFERPKGGCWEWKASKDGHGYGLIQRGGYGRKYGGKSIRAHRVSWMLHNGMIPDRLCVLHKCDNTSCVNPNHLFLGTKADNAHDRDDKGRHVAFHGEGHPMSKLTNENIKSIRHLFAIKKYNGVQLAKMYNISHCTAYRIINRVIWKHI